MIDDNPFEADELIAQIKALYPGDTVKFHQALQEIYAVEIAKLEPDQRLLALIEKELGL